MEHRYRSSGLDNVYLADPPIAGEAEDASPVPDSAGLHRAIGSWLVSSRRGLNGAEVRFLRTEMELTQRALAELLGATVQTVRYWEKHRGKEINGAADRLLRLQYSEALAGRDAIRSEMASLQHRADTAAHGVVLRRTPGGWRASTIPSR